MNKTNLCFFVLLVMFFQVIICDNIIYFLKFNYVVSNIIALIINIFVIFYLKKYKKIKLENNYCKYDLFFLILFGIITMVTIIIPDTFWDSYSYHIYLQDNLFVDKIYNDFFPGRTLTSFIYPIADRVFYMFRSILGFRLGTLPGYFLIVVMYYEIKKFLKSLLNKKIDDKVISLFSVLPLGVFIILQQIGTYYIDNFSIVLLLEILYVIICEDKIEFKDKLLYLFFLIGIAVCVKIINLVYIFLPFLFLIFSNIKEIKKIRWFDYILFVFVLMIPMLPYLCDTMVKTGNPVFPYYNNIFKSEYFENISWLDKRYGPKNFIQFVFWPIYILKYPEKAYESAFTDLMFFVGYICSIFYILYAFIYIKLIKKQEINNKTFILTIILLYLYIVWELFVIGYTRYAGIIPVLSSILCIYFLIRFFEMNKIIFCIFIALVVCISSLLGFENFYYYGSTKSYIINFFENKTKGIENIKKNLCKVFNDKNNIKYDIDGIWGVIDDDSCVPSLLNVDDRLVHLEYGMKTGNTEKTNKLYWDNVLNNDIYVPIYRHKLLSKIHELNQYNYRIIEIVDTLTDISFLDCNDYIYIAKVKYDENNNNNMFKVLNLKNNEFEYKKRQNDGKTLKVLLSTNGNNIKENTNENIKLDIILQKEGKLDKIIQTIDIMTDGHSKECKIDIENLDYDSIKIRLNDDEIRDRLYNNSIVIFSAYTE